MNRPLKLRSHPHILCTLLPLLILSGRIVNLKDETTGIALYPWRVQRLRSVMGFYFSETPLNNVLLIVYMDQLLKLPWMKH